MKRGSGHLLKRKSKSRLKRWKNVRLNLNKSRFPGKTLEKRLIRQRLSCAKSLNSQKTKAKTWLQKSANLSRDRPSLKKSNHRCCMQITSFKSRSSDLTCKKRLSIGGHRQSKSRVIMTRWILRRSVSLKPIKTGLSMS